MNIKSPRSPLDMRYINDRFRKIEQILEQLSAATGVDTKKTLTQEEYAESLLSSNIENDGMNDQGEEVVYDPVTEGYPATVSFDDVNSNFTSTHPFLKWTALTIEPHRYELRTEDANWGAKDAKYIDDISGKRVQYEWIHYEKWADSQGLTATQRRTVTIYIKAVDKSDHYSVIADSIALTNAAPATPTGLTFTPKKRANLLKWTKNSETDLDKYEIYRNTSNDSGGSTKIADTSWKNNTFRDTEIDDATTYYYWIKAVDTFENASAFSTVATDTSTTLESGDTTAPTWPGGTTLTLTVVPQGLYKDKGKWTATWSAAATDDTGVTAYEVEIWQDDTIDVLEDDKKVGKSKMSVSGTGIRCKQGTTTYQYYAKVRAYDKAGNVSADLTSATVTPTIPVPDNVAFTTAGSGDDICHWTNKDPWLVWDQLADESDLRDYEVHLTDDNWGAKTLLVYRGKGGKHKVTDWDRLGCTSHQHFFIKAYSKQGTWSATAGEVALDIGTPTMSGFTPSCAQSGNRSVKVRWTEWASFGIDAVKCFEIWYSTNASFDASVSDESAIYHGRVDHNVGVHTVSGLKRKTTYYFRIKPIGWLADGVQSEVG